MPKGRWRASGRRNRPHAVATSGDRKSAIVTAKNPRRGRFGFADVPDMTPEEHKRRGDAADALMRRFKREIASSKRS